jgi:DNA-binding NtrC family response regulator
MSVKILVVDDDKTQQHTLKNLISKKLGYEALEAENGHECLSFLTKEEQLPQLIILDLYMPVMDGMEVLELIGQQYPDLPVIVLTSNSKVDSAVQAMKLGAVDFLIKPIKPERVILSIQNALKINYLAKEVSRLNKRENGNLSFNELVGNEAGLTKSVSRGKKASASTIPVLLTGETGVGKEVFAQAIHGESDRGGKPFVAVNCGALPKQLIESILFGHEKGAFTGAIAKTAGKFREAQGGTIFLDEIGELPNEEQVKLLRVLQQKEVEPVGSEKTVPVNVRIISATNRDLNEAVKKGQFREDLLYRLNVFQIEIPPLRNRQSDILPMAEHFIKKYSITENKNPPILTESAEEFLQNHTWPGNVRELENAIHRAIVISESSQLETSDFTDNVDYKNIKEESYSPFSVPVFDTCGHLKTLEDIEKDILEMALQHHKNNVTQASKALGIAKSTFYRKRYKNPPPCSANEKFFFH